MGTPYLTIILLWCGNPTSMSTAYSADRAVTKCRREAIACVRKLSSFTTDDVIDKCLDKGK